MNCPKCNCEVPSGLLFCNECGFKIECVPQCRECGTSLKDGVLFCPVCSTPSCDNYSNAGLIDNGGSVTESGIYSKDDSAEPGKTFGSKLVLSTDDSIERTMTIPVIKPNSHRPSGIEEAPLAEQSGLRSGFGLKSGMSQTDSDKQKKSKMAGRKSQNGLSMVQKNILIFMAVFITVVFAGMMCIVAIMKTTYDTPVTKTLDSVVKKAPVDAEPEKANDESEQEVLQTEAGRSKQIDVYNHQGDIDLEYKFQSGISLQDVICVNKAGELKVHENPEFYFSCSVPESFVVEENGSVEVRYLAEDKTAYLDIGAFKNDKKWTMEAVRDAIIGHLGGVVDYQSSGEGWFAVNIIKNGTYYYQKCMVNDESIRYFEFAYPEEYSDVYSEYVSNIDSGFREIK